MQGRASVDLEYWPMQASIGIRVAGEEGGK